MSTQASLFLAWATLAGGLLGDLVWGHLVRGGMIGALAGVTIVMLAIWPRPIKRGPPW